MKIPIFQVDAFTNERFKGNPAAVCPLVAWLPDAVMQNVAVENNLAETAFIVPAGDRFEIRWFTPTVEVDLCGHATLASAYVLFYELGFAGDEMSVTTVVSSAWLFSQLGKPRGSGTCAAHRQN